MPCFPFIAEDIAPRPPGGADAAIADLHDPDAEQMLISTTQTPNRSVPASTRYCRQQRRAGFRASRMMRKSSMGVVKKTFVFVTMATNLAISSCVRSDSRRWCPAYRKAKERFL